MTLIDYWTRMSPLVLLLGIVCEPILGAPHTLEASEPAGTIAAVGGISPGLVETAIMLFAQPGMELLGGKDKFFPFPGMMDGQRPPRPVPSMPIMNGNKPRPPPHHQSYFQPMVPQMPSNSMTEQKDESVTSSVVPPPTPVAPPTPARPTPAIAVPSQDSVPAATPLETLTADENNLIHQQSQIADGNGGNSNSITPDKPVQQSSPVQEMITYENNHQNPSSPSNSVQSSFQTPHEPLPASNNGIGNDHMNQYSQGGHQTHGNQHIGMNLNANSADISTTSNVNMQVVTDGSSNSAIHYIGSRNPKPHTNYQHHQGTPSSNYVTKYLINFAKQTSDQFLK